MFIDKHHKLTDEANAFLVPTGAIHRQYEALRAFFVERLPSQEAAARFGYTPGSFRVLCHQFRQDPHRPFFLPERAAVRRPPRPPGSSAKISPLQQKVIALRQQNFSIYDIVRALRQEKETLSAPAVWTILRQSGFAKLPRRRDDERPAGAYPAQAPVADVRQLDWTPRQGRTDFGGLFLFVPMLVELDFDRLVQRVGLPGTPMIPASCALRSLLGLKLFGSARHSHVMSSVFDEGLALFAGLNAIPKRSWLTEYSCRIHPACTPSSCSSGSTP